MQRIPDRACCTQQTLPFCPQSISSSSPAPISSVTGAAGACAVLGGGAKAFGAGAVLPSFAWVFATCSRYFECQDGLESAPADSEAFAAWRAAFLFSSISCDGATASMPTAPSAHGIKTSLSAFL